MGSGKLLLIIGASLFGLCCVGGLTVSAISTASRSALPDQSRNNDHPYDPSIPADIETAAPTASASPATPAVPVAPTTARLSDDDVRNAVLDYKACPGKQGDTLRSILAGIFTLAQDDVRGSYLIDRSGDHARIGVGYVEHGRDKETVFDYDLVTHQVAGDDSLARSALETLKTECE